MNASGQPRLLAEYQARLQGKRIVAVEAVDLEGDMEPTLQIMLSDHTVWEVWRDGEGNGPGYLALAGTWKEEK